METASIFDLDISGEDFAKTKIYRAIKKHNTSKLQKAIYSGENVFVCDQDFNLTFLHLTVSFADQHNEDKYVPIVYQLSNAGVDPNAMDYKGKTALQLAIEKELPDVMEALIRTGTDLSLLNYRHMILELVSPFELALIDVYEKFEPGMWAAVIADDIGSVHVMVNSWCRVNIQKGGTSLLHYAHESGKSKELISVLEDIEVTIEFVHAVLAGDERRMLEFLMDAKPCNPHIMDISYQESFHKPLSPRSLRDTAIAMGHTHVLHLLPEDDPDSPNMNRNRTETCYNGALVDSGSIQGSTSPSETSTCPSNDGSYTKIDPPRDMRLVFKCDNNNKPSSLRSDNSITSSRSDKSLLFQKFYYEDFYCQADNDKEFDSDKNETFYHPEYPNFKLTTPSGSVRAKPNAYKKFAVQPITCLDYDEHWKLDTAKGNGKKGSVRSIKSHSKIRAKLPGHLKSKMCVVM